MAMLADIAKQVDTLQGILRSAERTRRFVEDFRRDNRLLGDFYSDSIRRGLALRGWFIAGTLYPHHYAPLAKALKHQRESEIEQFLVAHVRGLVPTVSSSVRARWPARKDILSDAFGAHAGAQYTLSVPVFLAQSDGIAADLLGAFMFTDHKGPITRATSDAIKTHLTHDPLAKSFLGLLLEVSGLRLETGKRDKLAASGSLVSPLNRHGVLHGLDCDYATEANSLRAVALLGFLDWVADVLPKQERQNPQQCP